jgi:hypothetical protein
MGYVDTQVLKNMTIHNSLRDFTISSQSELPHVCKGYAMGKQHKATYPTNPTKERSTLPGEGLGICGTQVKSSIQDIVDEVAPI